MGARLVDRLAAGALTVASLWCAGSSLQAQDRAADRRRSLDPNMPVSDDPRRVPVAPGPTGPEGTIVLVGGRVFDGTGTPARPATIVIERNRIAAAGRKADAAADAQLVPAGFVRNASYSAASTRSENRIFVLNNRLSNVSVESVYQGLTFSGVADRRVAVTNAGRNGSDGRTPLFLQTKYPTAATPIPIARAAEARLIIAENAVATNNLPAAVAEITALHTAAGLPPWWRHGRRDPGPDRRGAQAGVFPRIAPLR